MCVCPLQINVVKESRVYSLWDTPSCGAVTRETGIIAAKAKLNQLHKELADKGFSQVSDESYIIYLTLLKLFEM